MPPRIAIRRLMIAIAVLAVALVAGERAWKQYREQAAVQARLLQKQKLIRTLGPAATPQWIE